MMSTSLKKSLASMTRDELIDLKSALETELEERHDCSKLVDCFDSLSEMHAFLTSPQVVQYLIGRFPYVDSVKKAYAGAISTWSIVHFGKLSPIHRELVREAIEEVWGAAWRGTGDIYITFVGGHTVKWNQAHRILSVVV